MINTDNISKHLKKQSKAFLPEASGHAYKVSYNLGKFSKVSVQEVVEEMKAGRIFPLSIIKGTFDLPGNKVTLGLPYIHRLTFLPFSKNEVKVKKITKDGILLEALPKHIFQGTVYHKIERCKNELFYVIEVQHTPTEPYFNRLVSVGFAKLQLWQFFIKMNVVNAVRQLETPN